jgi:hypothetical protein
MNAQLMRFKPKDTTPEEWEKHWNNQTYTLQPLADVLKNIKESLGNIKADDFNTPNHYEKLVYELAQKQMIDKILSLLPDSLDK